MCAGMSYSVQTSATVRGIVHFDHLEDVAKSRPLNLRTDRHSDRRLTQAQFEQLGRISLFSGMRVLTVALSVRRIRDPPCSCGFLLAGSAITPLRLIQIAHSTASHCSTPSVPPHSNKAATMDTWPSCRRSIKSSVELAISQGLFAKTPRNEVRGIWRTVTSWCADRPTWCFCAGDPHTPGR